MRKVLLLLLTVPASMLAQNNPLQQCAAVASISLPQESDLPKPAIFPACEARKSYAGIGRPVNYAVARSCAWKERAAQLAELPQNPEAPTSWAIGGDLILVDLYANGLAVPRNLPLAMHLACEEGSGIAADAINDLYTFSTADQAHKKRFEVCDFAYSTFSMNFCADFENERKEERRKRTIRTLAIHWTPEQKSAFTEVQTAEKNYVSTHSKELDQGGTIHALRDIGSAEILHNNFLLDLRSFERGNLPKNNDAAIAEKRMTQQYYANLAEARKPVPVGEEGSAVNADGITEVQAAWKKYRDAWLAFAALRYPAAPAAAFRAYFAEERYRLLAAMYKQVERE